MPRHLILACMHRSFPEFWPSANTYGTLPRQATGAFVQSKTVDFNSAHQLMSCDHGDAPISRHKAWSMLALLSATGRHWHCPRPLLLDALSR